MASATKSKNTSRRSRAIPLPKLEAQIQQIVRKEMDSQQSRRHATDTYAQRLKDTDTKVTEFIQSAIAETTRAYNISVNSYIFSHFAAFAILIAGLTLLFLAKGITGILIVATILIAASVIWIISFQRRSPVNNIRFMVNHLAKLNVIFAGYIRQIHQVDAVFEDLVCGGKEITPENAEQLLNNLQDSMTEAMSAISNMSGDLDY